MLKRVFPGIGIETDKPDAGLFIIGTRVPVTDVVSMLVAGKSKREICAEFNLDEDQLDRVGRYVVALVEAQH